MDLAAKKRRIQNRNTALFLMVPTAILAKIIQLFFLPDKYFFDSWRMVGMLTGKEIVSGGAWTGYENTVNFHKAINILNLTTASQFSIFYGIVMTVVVMVIVSFCKEMEIKEVLFTLMATGVLNIYVFSINKEMIQILYFFAILVFINLPINNVLKILGCAGIYYIESILFRSYYVMMAGMIIGIYFVLLFVKRLKKVGKRYVVLAITACYIMVFVFFYLSSFIYPKDYNDALSVRDKTTNTIDLQSEDGGANSAIRNPIQVNGNIGIFMYDYVINSVRMMIPIELLFKSPGYFPFFAYQFFILSYVVGALKKIKRADSKVMVALSCFLSFFLGSVVFEPDFGSWVRHEATTFPVLQLIAYNSVNYKEDNTNYEAENV